MKEYTLYDKLRDTYEDGIKQKTSILELVDLMHTKEVRKEIEHYLEKDMKEKDIEKVEILINCAQLIYTYTGEDTNITDSEYDILFEKVKELDPTILFTIPVVANKNTVFHKYTSLRGTLDKVYGLTEEDILDNKSRKYLDEWITSAEKKLKDNGYSCNLNNEDIYVFPKWDGLSAIFEFSKENELQRVLTRGFTETNEAEDITHIFKGWMKAPYDTPQDHDYGLKTEVMCDENDMDYYNSHYNTDYKNSRAMTASILNSDTADERTGLLHIMHLRTSQLINGEETLQKLAPGAFNTPYIKCKLSDREKIREFATSIKYVGGLRCDGAVIHIINPKIQEILGRKDNKQKYEVAYKFTEETGYTKLIDINYTVGLFGRVNPVAEVKPIKLKGNTITNISLGSIERMKSLQLRKGDKVKILYDIIPYLTFDNDDEKCKRSKEEVIPVITLCPDCGHELETKEDGNILYCMNPDCDCRKKGRILNFLNKMLIENIAEATVSDFYDAGFLKSIKDIYKLNKNRKKICDLPGYKETSADKIIESIDVKREVSEERFLSALGMEGISIKTFEKLLDVITFDELLELCWDDNHEDRCIEVLCVVPGIQKKTACKIIKGIRDNEKLILFLEEELTLIPHKSTSSSIRFKACFTKVREKDAGIEGYTESIGGSVSDSVTKDTAVLVVPVLGISSSKVEKAKKYGIPIVPIDKYKEYCENNLA